MIPLPVVFIISLLAGLLSFGAIFLVARKIDNYGIVDAFWPFQFIGYAALYAALLDGSFQRNLFFLVLVGAWSLRLGTHLVRRVRAEHPREDPRYTGLRHSWGPRYGPRMFGFFLAQGLAGWILALPFAFPAAHSAPGLGALEAAGFVLGLAAVAGQASADRTLRRFKENPAHRKQVCRSGWWAYSRHPNYFFEWLVWVALAVFASASPLGWLAWISPAIILYLLLHVTGVPPAESRALQSRGELYRAYQRTTNRFFPGPTRRDAVSPGTDPL